MARPLGTRISGCVLIALAMLASMPSANAATGRIVFSGAVVEPTCSTESAHLDPTNPLRSMDGLVPARSTCGQTPTDPGRSYSRTGISLDATTIANDRLLGYFAGYANAESGVQAKLVVRTYD
jgi:type 1 fimbria pilin